MWIESNPVTANEKTRQRCYNRRVRSHDSHSGPTMQAATTNGILRDGTRYSRKYLSRGKRKTRRSGHQSTGSSSAWGPVEDDSNADDSHQPVMAMTRTQVTRQSLRLTLRTRQSLA